MQQQIQRQGVLYALGGFSGGLAAWIDKGRISHALVYQTFADVVAEAGAVLDACEGHVSAPADRRKGGSRRS